MTRRPADSTEPDTFAGDMDVIAELESYAHAATADPSRGLTDHVMAAVAREPVPRRGWLAWLPLGGAGASTTTGWMRFAAVAAAVVLAVVAVTVAGELVGVLRNGGVGGPSPSVTAPAPTSSLSPTPTVEPSPTRRPSPTPRSSAEPSERATPDATQSGEGSGTPEASDDNSGPGSSNSGGNSGPGGGG